MTKNTGEPVFELNVYVVFGVKEMKYSYKSKV